MPNFRTFAAVVAATAACAATTLAGCGSSDAADGSDPSAVAAGGADDGGVEASSEGDDGAAGDARGHGATCDPAPAAGTLYAQTDTYVGDTAETSMCWYRGEVLLIFNAAQLCGFTPETTALQKLQGLYSADGFTVLGFYSDDFGNQGGDPAACNAHYGVTFDTFGLAPVTGPNARPVFAWLEVAAEPGPDTNAAPSWNFSKYLVARDGTLVGHWDSAVAPDASEIVAAIEAELAKP